MARSTQTGTQDVSIPTKQPKASGTGTKKTDIPAAKKKLGGPAKKTSNATKEKEPVTVKPKPSLAKAGNGAPKKNTSPTVPKSPAAQKPKQISNLLKEKSTKKLPTVVTLFDEVSEDTLPIINELPEKEPLASEVAVLGASFDTFSLDLRILDVIEQIGFTKATLVQTMCLPFTLAGRDVAGFAQTGTGKTGVFVITAGQKLLSGEGTRGTPNSPAVLVLVPTRELAAQVEADTRQILGPLGLKSIAVYGGGEMEKQISALTSGVDIVVATPGRLFDLQKQKHVNFDNVSLFVCDEADRMFDMGFIDDVEYILRVLPQERVQKLMFSATGSAKVKELAFEYLDNPEYVETSPEQITPEKITQWVYALPAKEKFQALLGHLKTAQPECAIVFTNTKIVAEWVGYKLASNGIEAEVLTGDIPQRKRMALIKKIKDGETKVLVATDVLSRGLHVANLSHVYNFDIPEESESFIHRIGRTARAGEEGTAISFVCEDYGFNMGGVEKLLGFPLEVKPVPVEFNEIEDKSDYPFDDQGRVKVFGEVYPEKVVLEVEKPEIFAKKTDFEEKRETFETKDNRPSHQPKEQKFQRSPHVQRTSDPTVPFQKSEGLPHVAMQAERPIVPVAKPKFERSVPVDRPNSRFEKSDRMDRDRSVRRDDRARDTVEGALEAARNAAEQRRQRHQGGSSVAKVDVPSDHTNYLAAAGEKLGEAFELVQQHFISTLVRKVPIVTSILGKLGFGAKSKSSKK